MCLDMNAAEFAYSYPTDPSVLSDFESNVIKSKRTKVVFWLWRGAARKVIKLVIEFVLRMFCASNKGLEYA